MSFSSDESGEETAARRYDLTNNPAVSMPAASRLVSSSTSSSSKNLRPDAAVARRKTGPAPNGHAATNGGGIEVSDPTGEAEIIHPSASSSTCATAAGQQQQQRLLTKYDVGWRRVVRNFSPSWFSVTMGTGIVALVLITIPFKARWLYWWSVVFFGLNTTLFALALTISLLRYTLYPEIWTVMVADSTNSLFLGTVPMGFATLIEMWIFVCVPAWGPWATTVAWVCWMVDSIVAAAITLSLSVLLMSQSHQQSLDRITAAQLLPIAATIVAAGTGAEIAEVLPNPSHALGTLLASYIMWGMSVPLAMAVLVMYYQRLALHKLPPREVIVSCFLPLGPLGMGGYTIFYLGKIFRKVVPLTTILHSPFPSSPSSSSSTITTTTTPQPLISGADFAAEFAYLLGLFISLFMWSFGLVWLTFALATIYRCRPFPFNMGWWGFTFPLGVYAISTMTFGIELPSLFFRVLGTIFGTAVVALWCVVAAGTVKGAWSGRLFYAPCVAGLKESGRDLRLEKERRRLAALGIPLGKNGIPGRNPNLQDVEKGDEGEGA